MKKIILASAFLALSTAAIAEVKCYTMATNETLKNGELWSKSEKRLGTILSRGFPAPSTDLFGSYESDINGKTFYKLALNGEKLSFDILLTDVNGKQLIHKQDIAVSDAMFGVSLEIISSSNPYIFAAWDSGYQIDSAVEKLENQIKEAQEKIERSQDRNEKKALKEQVKNLKAKIKEVKKTPIYTINETITNLTVKCSE